MTITVKVLLGNAEIKLNSHQEYLIANFVKKLIGLEKPKQVKKSGRFGRKNILPRKIWKKEERELLIETLGNSTGLTSTQLSILCQQFNRTEASISSEINRLKRAGKIR